MTLRKFALLVLVSAVACEGETPTSPGLPTTNSGTPSAQTTFTLSGVVQETAPSPILPLAGTSVEIIEGPEGWAQEHQRVDRLWRSLHWVLRFALDPNLPVIASDQSVGMDGYVDDPRLALHDSRTTLFFPVSWDMCLFGSPARLEPECAEFLEQDLRRLWSFVVKQTTSFVVSPTPSDVIVGEFTA